MADSFSGSPSSGPVRLASILDKAMQLLQPTPSTIPSSDGFLYSGSRQESVPRALFLDNRLTPLERNAWQVFRILLNEDGVTAFPTYDQLRRYLSSTPCTAQASHETVARALTLLRLTRWLTLAMRRRDPKTGRIKGNLYVLHDEPLTPFEAMQIDPEYLGLVSHALTHASKAIQIVGNHALREIADDPMLKGRSLPTRLDVLAQRLKADKLCTYPQGASVHDSEEGATALLRNDLSLPSDSEAGGNTSETGLLRNPKQDRTNVLSTCISNLSSTSTVPRARELQNLQLPEKFHTLRREQQSGALVALHQVDAELRQAVLDEWEARCSDSNIRNPAGYLFGIIQKAIRGEFKVWAGQQYVGGMANTPKQEQTTRRTEPVNQPASFESAQAHLAHLQALLAGKDK